jgi:hypothetical protein
MSGLPEHHTQNMPQGRPGDREGHSRGLKGLGSLTQDRGLEGDPCGGSATPFHGEEAIVMVYNGCLPFGRCRISKLSHGTLTRCGYGPGNAGL